MKNVGLQEMADTYCRKGLEAHGIRAFEVMKTTSEALIFVYGDSGYKNKQTAPSTQLVW